MSSVRMLGKRWCTWYTGKCLKCRVQFSTGSLYFLPPQHPAYPQRRVHRHIHHAREVQPIRRHRRACVRVRLRAALCARGVQTRLLLVRRRAAVRVRADLVRVVRRAADERAQRGVRQPEHGVNEASRAEVDVLERAWSTIPISEQAWAEKTGDTPEELK